MVSKMYILDNSTANMTDVIIHPNTLQLFSPGRFIDSSIDTVQLELEFPSDYGGSHLIWVLVPVLLNKKAFLYTVLSF